MRTKNSGTKKPGNNVARIMKTPIRAMSRALDLYVKGVNNFSNTYTRPLRTTQLDQIAPLESQRLPRSFSTGYRLPACTDEPPEGALVRSISTASTGSRATNLEINSFELLMIQRHFRQMQLSSASRKAALRSRSVGMGKIEEDRVSSFRDDGIVLKSTLGIQDDRLPTKRSF